MISSFFMKHPNHCQPSLCITRCWTWFVNLIQNEILKKQPLLIIVDVSASTGAFVGTVCLIAVRRSVSGRTGCRRCGRVGMFIVQPMSIFKDMVC